MKISSKLFTLVFALILAFILVACSYGISPEDSTASPPTTMPTETGPADNGNGENPDNEELTPPTLTPSLSPTTDAEPTLLCGTLGTSNVQDERVDLRPFLAANLDEVHPLFGVEISNELAMTNYRNYYYDTGLIVGIIEGGYITSILIDYGNANDRAIYYFDGIDDTSTFDDIVALFGDQPAAVRDGTGDAVEDFGYWADEHVFVYFSIDADGSVVAISFFFA